QREQTRRSAAESYEQWLHSKWIFKIEPHEEPAGALARPPHLLDFHDLRRPESMAFWLLMVGSFCTGFIPPRKKPAVAGG
ncbi:MAG TPA: hypothetical protein VKH44_02865, partial [Pirellulaceae bacterium]|nr:hypothetical protein [Pirellulaceae bacterium]